MSSPGSTRNGSIAMSRPRVEAERLAAVAACSDRARPAASGRPSADSRRCPMRDRRRSMSPRRNASTEIRMKVGGRDDGDREHAASRALGGVAEAEARRCDRPPAKPRRPRRRAAASVRRQRHAMRIAAPAPKNAPAGSIAFAAAAAIRRADRATAKSSAACARGRRSARSPAVRLRAFGARRAAGRR